MLRRILNLAPEGAVAAAPAAAPAAPAPTDTAAPLAGSSGEDIFAELDAMDKPAKAIAPKEPEKAPEKKPDPVKEPEKVPEKQPPANEPKGIKEMREHGKRMETENKTLASKIAEYERKIADYDRRGKDATALTERMATLEKQLEERQSEIRALKQEASPEFKEKYDKPFDQAANFAKQIVTGLEVITKNGSGETGTRAATWDDFAGIYHLAKTSMGKATTAAKELFGDSSQTVLNHINELHRLDYVRNQALVEERAKAKERADSEIAESSKQREWTASTWRQINTDLAEKSPEVFQADPKDKQRAELFTKSLALVDSRHNGAALTPIQRVTLDAQVRLRAAAFPVLRYDVNKLTEENAELKAKLAEFNDNAPGNTQRAGGDSTNAPAKKSFNDELNELKV